MKTHKFLLILLSSCLSVFLSSSAQANELSGLVGYNLGTSVYSSGGVGIPTGSVSTVVLGGGYYFEFSRAFGLDWEAFYFHRGASVNSATGIFTFSGNVTVGYLTVPLVFQYSLVPEYFRIGLGPYFGMALGSVNLPTGVSIERSAFGWNTFDFGAIGSLRGKIPVSTSIHLILDVRYLLGFVSNVSNSTLDSKLRDLSVLVGLAFPL